MKVVVLLCLLTLGQAAPLLDCETLIKPITIKTQEMLGRWHYIGGSSDLPGSRSLGYLMTSSRLDISATSQSNILDFIQTQKIHGDCSSLAYNVTFENNVLLIERPFYLKEVYLQTDCRDCLLAHEEVTSGGETFTSLMLFSKSRSVSPADEDNLRRQAQCLKMPEAITRGSDNDECPENLPVTDGLAALNLLLEAKGAHRVARILDQLFDWFIN